MRFLEQISSVKMRNWQIVVICAGLMAGTEIRAQDIISVDLQRKAQHFSGIGAQIWPGDLLAMQTLFRVESTSKTLISC